MSHDQHREAALDRLLRGTVGRPAEADASETCLDAEALAAWMDGHLAPAERRAAETHASQCARCQSMLAVMVQANAGGDVPAASATIASGFRGSLRWLVPLTGGALAAALWLMVDPQMRAPARAPVPVSSERAEEALSPPSLSRSKEDVAPPVELKDESRRDAPAVHAPAERQRVSRDARPTPAQREADSAPVDAPAGLPQAAPAILAERAAPVLPPSAPPPSMPKATEPRPSEAPPPPARAERAETLAAGSPAAGTLAFRTAAEPVVIPSPDPASRWRITPPAVEHSTDGGATWVAQSLPDGVVPVAGSAPSANVCWIVGRAGVVLRTTDARTWQRVSFPEAIDLTAIHATDERTATVQTADGRSLHTSDGGGTWRR